MMTLEETLIAFPGLEFFIGFTVSFVFFAIAFFIGHKVGGAA